MTTANHQCQKVGTKEDMRACSACLYTYYCSKVRFEYNVVQQQQTDSSLECQETAWKEGDHKTMCKMKQQERLGMY